MAAAAAFVFYFSCVGKANAEELPDINLDILGDDFTFDSDYYDDSTTENKNRIISSRTCSRFVRTRPVFRSVISVFKKSVIVVLPS